MHRRAWISGAALAGVVVTIVRLATSWGRDEYSIWPDEPAQLAIARYVGGGTAWNMHDHSVWRPLFGTLLAPAHWFTDDPVTVFHAALWLNAVLGGIAAALLVVVARRLTTLGVAGCVAVAVAVSLLPGVVFTTNFVFSESLVSPLYLGTLLALLRFHDRPSLRDGVTAAVLAGAAFGAHSRMLPLSVILLGVVGLAAAGRRLPIRDATAIAAVAVAVVFGVSWYTSLLVDRLWNRPSTRNSVDGVIDQLGNGPAVLVSLLGQTWYLLVASLGIVVYGAAHLVVSARRSDTDQRGRRDARLLLVTVGSLVALSVVFMSDRWRSDQLVYGRYNDAVVTPVLVVGLAVLAGVGTVSIRRVPALAAGAAIGTIAAGALLWQLRSEVLSDGNGLEPMILGLQPFRPAPTSIDVLRISVWAAALTLVLAGAAVLAAQRGARWMLGAVAAVLLALGWMRTDEIVDRSWNGSGDVSAVAALRDGPLRDGVRVDMVVPPGSNATNRMMLYQFHLPRTPFTVVERPDDGTAAYVFGRLDRSGDATGDSGDDDELRAAGAELIWRDPRGRYALWER
jgi:hypothetical protein